MNRTEKTRTGTTEEYLSICLLTRIHHSLCSQTTILNSLNIVNAQFLQMKLKAKWLCFPLKVFVSLKVIIIYNRIVV